MSINLESLSNDNMVIFYKKELIMINEGSKATDIFSFPMRRKLIKIGILELKLREDYKKYLVLTKYARALAYGRARGKRAHDVRDRLI